MKRAFPFDKNWPNSVLVGNPVHHHHHHHSAFSIHLHPPPSVLPMRRPSSSHSSPPSASAAADFLNRKLRNGLLLRSDEVAAPRLPRVSDLDFARDKSSRAPLAPARGAVADGGRFSLAVLLRREAKWRVKKNNLNNLLTGSSYLKTFYVDCFDCYKCLYPDEKKKCNK